MFFTIYMQSQNYGEGEADPPPLPPILTPMQLNVWANDHYSDPCREPVASSPQPYLLCGGVVESCLEFAGFVKATKTS